MPFTLMTIFAAIYSYFCAPKTERQESRDMAIGIVIFVGFLEIVYNLIAMLIKGL